MRAKPYDSGRTAKACLIVCAVIVGAAATLARAREGAAQRAPLIVASVEPMDPRLVAHPRARVWELRVDDDGTFAFEGRTGRLSAAQLRQLRAERGRVRWEMARSTTLCDAIATESHRVQSQGRSISWRSPCEPAPHPSVLRFISRAQALVRAAPSAPIRSAADAGTSAASTPDAAQNAVADSAVASADPQACTGPGQCVLACPEVPGCCGFPCGCTRAVHRDHLAAFTAEYARTCQRGPRCEAVGCAMERRSASCVNGRCRAVAGPGF
ncbi:MAG: hypothetical protein JNK05_31160 [Myxococcales bacterium]|nr:hypothetical protein [Myxococcales bacterium]